LNLIELTHSHWLGDVWVVNIFEKYIIALLPDFLEGSNRLILIQASVEAEVRKRLWEVM
jgi:hypothetical protein